MKKARSRLKLETPLVKSVEPLTPTSGVLVERKKIEKKQGKFDNHLKHLPTLFIGLFFVFLLLAVTIIFSPEQLKNFILPNSYLPFFVCFFMASFFLLSWVLLDSMISMWWAILLTVFVFLRIQQVSMGWLELILLTLGFAIGALVQMWRKLIHHQN